MCTLWFVRIFREKCKTRRKKSKDIEGMSCEIEQKRKKTHQENNHMKTSIVVAVMLDLKNTV